MADEKRRLPEYDAFVKERLQDRGEPRGDLVQIAGLVGESSRKGYLRLFTNPDLSECFDIPEDQIESHQPLDRKFSPLGGSTLWIKGDATLIRTSIDTVDAQSAFLSGDLAEDVLPEIERANLFNTPAIFSTPICSVVSVVTSVISIVTAAVCTKRKTCAKTCKNCPFTQQAGCNPQ
jgi:hypothetical protein